MSEFLIIEQLEKRMRPGQHSQGAFLGENESLEYVIAKDNQTLTNLGINHEQIASALGKLLESVFKQEKALTSAERIKRETNFPNLYKPDTIPIFSKDNLPNTNVGYLVGCFQVFIVTYRGFQVCPWDECGEVGGFDFMVLNRNTGTSFTAPALIIHLIRFHHFFEGIDSPYRVDPGKVVHTLEML